MAEPPIDQDAIYGQVRAVIADTLQISEDKIQPDTSLVRDLAVESLDFIDINFRLEEHFNIGMPRKYLLEHVEELFGEGTAIDERGKLTEAAVTIWSARLGDSAPPVHAGMSLEEVPGLVTPRTLSVLAQQILETCPASCPACGKPAWTLTAGKGIRCGECDKPAPLANGDTVIRQWLEEFRARGGLAGHSR